MDIHPSGALILHLLQTIQQQSEYISFLLKFICKFIPVRQWTHDDSKSPKYQKFKIDKLPIIIRFFKQDWQFLIQYYKHRYDYDLRPVRRRGAHPVPEDKVCPACGVPHDDLYGICISHQQVASYAKAAALVGLTNENLVSAEFQPQKQIAERLNRTFKASY